MFEFDQGYIAYLVDTTSILENPYTSKSTSFYIWERGWCAACGGDHDATICDFLERGILDINDPALKDYRGKYEMDQ